MTYPLPRWLSSRQDGGRRDRTSAPRRSGGPGPPRTAQARRNGALAAGPARLQAPPRGRRRCRHPQRSDDPGVHRGQATRSGDPGGVAHPGQVDRRHRRPPPGGRRRTDGFRSPRPLARTRRRPTPVERLEMVREAGRYLALSLWRLGAGMASSVRHRMGSKSQLLPLIARLRARVGRPGAPSNWPGSRPPR